MAQKHASLLHSIFPNMKIGVASRDMSRAERFKSRLHLQGCFGSYISAINSDFEIFLITTPPKYHLGLVENLIDREKHIIIEKPIFNSIGEFRQIWPKLMCSKGKILVAENHWFDPFHRKIKDFLVTNDLGKPFLFDLTRLGLSKTSGWRSNPAEMPLGALHEGGVHWARRLNDLACIYEKEPYNSIESVRAHKPTFSFTHLPYEDTILIIAKHKSGLISRLLHSWGIPMHTSLLDFSKIILEHGAVYFNSFGIIGFAFGKNKKTLLPSLGDRGGFKEMWRHFISCIQQNGESDINLKDIFMDFAYIDAAYRSLESGKEEPLEKIPL